MSGEGEAPGRGNGRCKGLRLGKAQGWREGQRMGGGLRGRGAARHPPKAFCAQLFAGPKGPKSQPCSPPLKPRALDSKLCRSPDSQQGHQGRLPGDI